MNVKIEEPGKDNVHNNAFYAEEELLRSELQAMRDCNPLSARHWIVSICAAIVTLLVIVYTVKVGSGNMQRETVRLIGLV